MKETPTRNVVFCFLDIDGVIATLESARAQWLEVQGLDFDEDTPSDRPLPMHRTSCEYWPFSSKALAAFHRLQLELIR